jgi:antitoxin (DNA-binding transcriptional repressor) of toxin-antitoxin stability system
VTLARKEAGLLLLEHGQPVARIIPLPEPKPQRIDPLHPGAAEVSEDFDTPLPDEFWLGRQ